VAKVVIINRFLERAPEISMISLNRLIEGGAAMFAPINKNHSRVRLGEVIRRPLVKITLRE
jgi:hypothetical protein